MAESDKKETEIIDYESDEQEFSDAIENHQNDDDFFDVPEWRENKETEEKNENSEDEKVDLVDLKEQKLKERIEFEEKLSPEEKEVKKSEALNVKKLGNELYLEGKNSEAIENYDKALEMCPLLFKEDRAFLHGKF